MNVPTVTDLLSPAVLGVLVAIIIQFTIKPSLQKRFPKDENGERDANYAIVMNTIALLLSVVLAFAVTVATDTTAQDWPIQALILAVYSTGVAIGSAEATTNVRGWIGPPPSQDD